MVVKKDGRREKFDRQKVLTGLLKACEKRPVADGEAGRNRGRGGGQAGRQSGPRDFYYRDRRNADGEAEGLDKIAYVRFASVYRDFQDVEAFLNELKNLVLQKRSLMNAVAQACSGCKFPVTKGKENIFYLGLNFEIDSVL